MKDSKKYLISSIILVIIAIVYTLLVKFVDVASIGPEATKVGFQTLNGYIRDIFPYNDLFYKVSKYAGFIPLAFALLYGGIGFLSLIKTKSLKKIDNKLFILAGFYVVVLVVYILFEKVVINYRPFIIDVKEGLEASYPSTHTLLAICFCGSSLLISKYFIKKDLLRNLINIGTWLLMVFIVVTRVISGVHWASDIIGGIIISLALLNIFYMAVLITDEPKEKEKKERRSTKKAAKKEKKLEKKEAKEAKKANKKSRKEKNKEYEEFIEENK